MCVRVCLFWFYIFDVACCKKSSKELGVLERLKTVSNKLVIDGEATC